MDINADGKVAKKIQERIKSIHSDASTFIYSVDDDSEKYDNLFLYFVIVFNIFTCRIGIYVSMSSVHLSRNISAKDWLDAVINKLGKGKGGGKDDQAMGNIPSGDQDTLKALHEVAIWYSENKLM